MSRVLSFKSLCNKALILDGFDEIDNDHRHIIEQEILDLSNNNNGIRIIISSRFDARFSSWNEFYTYTIQPLDKNAALELVDKLDYDENIKKKFIDELDRKLFQTHTSFASNPLLLTLMLLTYEQIAEIPNKIHIFYEQAFLTLFTKHDSFKSIYKRNIMSKLSADDFKKILEIFCLYSYCERRYYFTNDEIIRCLEKSIEVSNLNVQVNDFLSDLLDAVCILQRDGLGFTFTHRSFQEYFTASFLVNKTMNEKFKIFEKIASISFQDNVIDLIFDMNSNLIEKEWIIPKIEIILKSVDETEMGPWMTAYIREKKGFSYDISAMKVDYETIYAMTGMPKEELEKNNIIPGTSFYLADDSWICVRPSGTEPKCKLYIGVKKESMAESEGLMETLKQDLQKIIVSQTQSI